MRTDIAVIGAGPAGLAAAVAAKDAGVSRVTVIERDREAGGILSQCIHSGFGLRYFKEELTGPEYAERFYRLAEQRGVEFLYDTTVTAVSANAVRTFGYGRGAEVICTKAVVLAMGCRERSRGAIGLPGTRPSGVLTAGLAQRYINMEGRMIGRRAVILGSGDIGLIMARRLTLEGAKVLACVEIMPYSGGLRRNIVQCLDDFDIPLLLSHTVVGLRGKERVEGVTVARVDENLRPVPGTERDYPCDTLLLSVGLIPENELSAGAGIALDPRTRGPLVFDNCETGTAGIFACGNAVQVHDLVDFVSEEGTRAGRAAAEYILRGEDARESVAVKSGEGIAYTVPQRVRLAGNGAVDLHFRVRRPERRAEITVTSAGEEILRVRREYLTPGEMERIRFEKASVRGEIFVKLEAFE